MATVTVELNAGQIVDAFRQLPAKDRQYVIDQLLSDIGNVPRGEKAIERFDELRDSFRMDSKKERRLSTLLAKSNEGPLAKREQQELDTLLDESQERTLQLTLAVITSGAKRKPENGRRRKKSGK